MTIRTESILEEYLGDMSRRGGIPEGAFDGAAGGSACGDLVRISLVPAPDFTIGRVTWEAEGCAALIASAAAASEMVEGATILDAATVSPDDLDRAVGGLGPMNRHAATLVADALHRALSGLASSGIPLARPSDGRIAVAVSGGVDSAVACLLAVEDGAEVVGVTVKLWADPETDGTRACCSPEAVLSARAITHSIGLPHFTLDLEQAFRSRVVEGFLDGYRNGRTPNPCILCNGEVRIDAMVDLVDRLGADSLATGHYARIVEDPEGPLIAEGEDRSKDQSYMLAALEPETIARLDFPLRKRTKTEVRAVAERHGLEVARKPESQDLCFLAGTDKNRFLARHGGLVGRPGPLVDASGDRVGTHEGHHRFTVGQRRGLGVAVGKPRYVTAVDADSNRVTVGSREDLMVDRVRLRDVTLHRSGSEVDRVRLRYRSDAVAATIDRESGRHPTAEVRLEAPFIGVAPGQTAVLMRGPVVVGHGTIE